MSDNPSAPELTLQEIVAASEIPYPAPRPITDITVAMVAWNEEARLPVLLHYLRPWFTTLAVAVQKSNDDTLAIASRLSDVLVVDEHRGFGDATFGPRLLPLVRTKWTFKVDCDEWPSEELLGSLPHAVWYAETNGLDGVWVPFRSSVDGFEYEEQHGHLRLFETQLSWPATLHSRPMTGNTVWWPEGYVRHDRTLDEMMQDYIRYFHAGKGYANWEEHNKMMMRSACEGIAEHRGWDYVKAFPWWPEVESIAF